MAAMAPQGAQCRAVDLPGEAWGCVTEELETHEKVRLAATCRTLRAASVHWFRHDVIELGRGALRPQEIAWLCRVHAGVDLTLALGDWHAVDTLGAAGARLVGLSLAVRPKWQPLPARLAGLTQLSRLSLANNSFPSGWQHLPRQLRVLDLGSCTLWQVPQELAGLTQLSSLSLASNELREGGGWQHLPRQLRHLDLSSCGLWDVPQELAALTQLSRLSLARNEPMTRFNFDRLPQQLQHVDLSSCRLQGMPWHLSRLAHLTSLRLDDNPMEDRSWWGLERLEQLQRLHLQRCRLQQVPARLARLTALTSLSLASSPIKGGWEWLPRQLQELDLQWCGLQQVPAELGALSQLSQLSLDRNHIAGGWEHLPLQLRPLMPRGRGPQLPAALSRVLGPSIWVPVSDFVRSPPLGWDTLIFLLIIYSFPAISIVHMFRNARDSDNL